MHSHENQHTLLFIKLECASSKVPNNNNITLNVLDINT